MKTLQRHGQTCGRSSILTGSSCQLCAQSSRHVKKIGWAARILHGLRSRRSLFLATTFLVLTLRTCSGNLGSMTGLFRNALGLNLGTVGRRTSGALTLKK